MNTFTIVFLYFHACLVQNVFGQCTGGAAVVAEPGLTAPGLATPYDLGAPYGLGVPFAYDDLAGRGGVASATPFGYRAGLSGLAYPAAGLAPYGNVAYPAPYGGAGEGNVAVAGELPVAGSTVVAGQVPIMGAVSFGGAVPAAGSVSINGRCACSCGILHGYLY